MRVRGRRTVAAVVGALALLGCDAGGATAPSPRAGEAGDPPPDAGEPAPGATSSRSPSERASPGPTTGSGALLDVAGRTLDGGELDLATLRGDQVVLWMWAPW